MDWLGRGLDPWGGKVQLFVEIVNSKYSHSCIRTHHLGAAHTQAPKNMVNPIFRTICDVFTICSEGYEYVC